MIHTRTFPRTGSHQLVRGLVLVAALAAIAIVAVVLWQALRPASPALGGVILYTTAGGDATVEPDGSPVRLQGPPAVEFVRSGGVEEFPAPGGGAVAFVQREDAGAWLALRDGGPTTRLALLADESSPPLVNGVKGDAQVVGGVPLTVSWSPDARYLAYGGLTGLPYTLHVVERATGAERSFALDGGFIGELVWSPSGDRLAISTYSPDRVDHAAYVLDPNGGAPVRLIDGCHIVWSPEGEHIVLHRDPQREPGAWIVAVDGSQAYALTNERTAFPLAWQAE